MLVTGPVPPGTGVIALATVRLLAQSTSPTTPAPSAVSLMPKSNTTAPGLSIAPVISPALPTAAATMSPCRTISARFGVREWQIVTVACRASSRCANGLPTTLERPTTTACLPAGSMVYASSSAMPPAGVFGMCAVKPCAKRPALVGCKPSTSLRGSSAAIAPSADSCLGNGICTSTPLMVGSAQASRIAVSRSFCVMSPANVRCSKRKPTPSHERRIERTYQSEAASPAI